MMSGALGGDFVAGLRPRLQNPRTRAPPRPKTPKNPPQMAIYKIGQSGNNHYVDTNCLCVEIDINIPNPTSIDRIAVPP